MKKTIEYLMATTALILVSAGCSFLDISPDLGMDEQEVFSTWANYDAYFKQVYYGKKGEDLKFNISLGYPLSVDMNDRRFAWVSCTDMSDNGRRVRSANFKMGSFGENVIDWTTSTSRKPISDAMFHVIRVVNKCIENVDMLQDGKEDEINDMLGQCYFIRGYAHFVLCRMFGGMPYLDHSLKAGEDWDLTRLSGYETYRRAADDMYTAYRYLEKAGKMRRDAVSGAGHLRNDPDMEWPCGVAALAMRSRVLLYAASPLNNTGNDTGKWKDAADAATLALQKASEYGYSLVSGQDWHTNTWGVPYSEEHIWAWNYGNSNGTGNWTGIFTLFQNNNASSSGGICPTQNHVDRYETIDGYALNTEADRKMATAAGSYNEQDPYSNRDPRLDYSVIHDGSKDDYNNGRNSINIHYDPEKGIWPSTRLAGSDKSFTTGIDWGSQDTKGYTNTGYYCYRWWNGRGDRTRYHHTDPLVRLAELYLNYAEAANEYAGPKTTVGSNEMTAEEAVNFIRRRVGMPDVRQEYTTDNATFRERIQNERTVELAFEGNHYYYDIRRWKIAPQTMSAPQMGMRVEKTEVSAEYPNGRKYIRTLLPANRQSVWKDAMYYIAFPTEEANKMSNFINNEIW